MTMSLHRVSFAIGLIAAGALSSAAFADPSPWGQPQTFSRTVRLADVDLHTVDGAKVAAQRIKNAAEWVCGEDHGPIFAEDYSTCRNDAIDRALASLNAPLVSAALGRPASPALAAR
jgi:UrcA family protein